MVAGRPGDAVVPRLVGRADENAGRVARAAGVGVRGELCGGGARLNGRPVQLLLNVQAGRAAGAGAAAAAAGGGVHAAGGGGGSGGGGVAISC